MSDLDLCQTCRGKLASVLPAPPAGLAPPAGISDEQRRQLRRLPVTVAIMGLRKIVEDSGGDCVIEASPSGATIRIILPG